MGGVSPLSDVGSIEDLKKVEELTLGGAALRHGGVVPTWVVMWVGGQTLGPHDSGDSSRGCARGVGVSTRAEPAWFPRQRDHAMGRGKRVTTEVGPANGGATFRALVGCFSISFSCLEVDVGPGHVVQGNPHPTFGGW